MYKRISCWCEACTAAPIEISYHDEDTLVAEIEFVDIDVWKTEVDIVLNYLFDEDGNLLHKPPPDAQKPLDKVCCHWLYPSNGNSCWFYIQFKLVYPGFDLRNPLRNAEAVLEAFPSTCVADTAKVSDATYRHNEPPSGKEGFRHCRWPCRVQELDRKVPLPRTI